jgi:hypothetical protein
MRSAEATMQSIRRRALLCVAIMVGALLVLFTFGPLGSSLGHRTGSAGAVRPEVHPTAYQIQSIDTPGRPISYTVVKFVFGHPMKGVSPTPPIGLTITVVPAATTPIIATPVTATPPASPSVPALQAASSPASVVAIVAGVPPRGEATAFGCGAALAYLHAYAAPGFVLECPASAQGHQATTMCVNGSASCDLGRYIMIADPCAAAYMNEASNSWVLLGLSDAVIDPYGSCG